MNLAYETVEPYGLSTYDEFTRWQIVGGDNTNWSPYSNPSGYIDQLALNGLYCLSKSSNVQARRCWDSILDISKYAWNADTQQYDYPGNSKRGCVCSCLILDVQVLLKIIILVYG